MLTETEAKRLHEELVNTQKPLFFYHDDPDGLASYLLCYRFLREGIGLPVKAHPKITLAYANFVREYNPDKVFVLDVAMVDQEFIDAVSIPVVWVDHHSLLDRDNVLYLNPRKRDINVPTPVLIWQAISHEIPSDLWIATVGSIGDWHFPHFATEFRKKYPDLLPANVNSVEEALFETPIGTLVKAFSFILKGNTSYVKKLVSALSKIKEPYEILQQTSEHGTLIWEHYLKVNEEYEKLKTYALKTKPKGKLFVCTYQHDGLSLTKDLANELLYHFKDKVIVFGREKEGDVRCSLRAPAGIDLHTAVMKALSSVEGHGGGHESACGCSVKKEDFDRFLERLGEEIEK